MITYKVDEYYSKGRSEMNMNLMLLRKKERTSAVM